MRSPIQISFLFLTCLLTFLYVSKAGSIPDRALIAFDRVLNQDLVEGRNVTVTYTIQNVGTRPATNVVLKDLSFPASRFERHDTTTNKWTWSSIAPQEKQSVSIILLPKRHGTLHVSAAVINYKDPEQGSSFTSRLNAKDTVQVQDLVSYRRIHDSHTTDWLFFAIAFVMLVVGPGSVSNVMEKGVAEVGKKKN